MSAGNNDIPEFVKKLGLAKYYTQGSAGSITLAHHHCINPRSGYSAHDARVQTNQIALQASWAMSAKFEMCKSQQFGPASGGVRMYAGIEGGLIVRHHAGA
eukprot:COSAG02_NODE_5095_length_4636_cov_17.414371_4_plen_101_part_00